MDDLVLTTDNTQHFMGDHSSKDGNDFDVHDSAKSALESTADNEVIESQNEQTFADSSLTIKSVSDQEFATYNQTNLDQSSKDDNDLDVGCPARSGLESTAENQITESQNDQTSADLTAKSFSDQEITTNLEQSLKVGNDLDVGSPANSALKSTAENHVTESQNDQTFADLTAKSVSEQEFTTNLEQSSEDGNNFDDTAIESTPKKEDAESQIDQTCADSNLTAKSFSDQEITTNLEKSSTDGTDFDDSAVESTAKNEVTESQNDKTFADSNLTTQSISEQEIPTDGQTNSEQKLTEWLDVLGNGLLMKKTISEGSGKRPVIENEVIVKYQAKIKDEDGVVESNDDFKLVVRDGDHPPLFDIITMLMNEGETCVLVSDPQYAYGTEGNPPSVPGNATLEVKMELLKVNDGPYSDGYDIEEQIIYAEKKRVLGNEFYKAKNFKKAEIEYRKSLKCSRAGLEQNKSENPEIESRLKQKCVHSYNNLTLTLMMLGCYDEALTACQAADQLQPHSPKTLYRKGKILCRLGKNEDGLACLKEAVELEPGDRLICKEYNNQRNELNKQLQKQKEMYRKMLGESVNNEKATVMKKEQTSWFYNNWARLLGGSIAVGVGLIGVYVAQKI